MLCDYVGVWDRKQLHNHTGVHNRGHQLCYCPGIHSRHHPRSCPCPCLSLMCRGCAPPLPMTVPPHPWWDLFDSTSLQKWRLTPFPVAAGQAFFSSHSPVNNLPCDDLTGNEGCGYGGSCQYRGSSGTGHSSCDPSSSLLVGMPNVGLSQSCKETYTGWDNMIGKISTSRFFVMFFTSFLLLV